MALLKPAPTNKRSEKTKKSELQTCAPQWKHYILASEQLTNKFSVVKLNDPKRLIFGLIFGASEQLTF